MTRHQKRREYPPARPLSNWTIALGAVIVLGIAVTAWVVLLRRYGGAEASVELDAIRTAGALVVGTGGAFALLLAARRQRSTELTLVHTEHDATERRITELYTKAADQLGSDQAPVRLAGLYALERLAHSTVEHRQTIVDVICAYLRMPYTSPPEPPETPQAGTPIGGRDHGTADSPLSNDRHPPARATLTDRPEQPRQEREVRLTAQDILTRNLRLPPTESRRRWWAPWRGVYREPPWPGIRLNLTGALLLDVNLTNCRIREVNFTGAQFTGQAYFIGAQFTSWAYFRGAQFTGPADFSGAQFTGPADFSGAQFTGPADFSGAQFTGPADFIGAQFTSPADFIGAQFTSPADFSGAQFTSPADFSGAQFTSLADFNGAQFTSLADFNGAQFTGPADFSGAQFTGQADFHGAHASGPRLETVWPLGWTMRPAQPDNGEDPAARYLVRSEDPAG